MPQLRNAAACRRAVNEALVWLKARCGSEEAWMAQSQPLPAYHKAPYLLAVGGGPEECRQALIWIQANLLTSKGDLLAAPVREGQPPGPMATVREKAWIALAAQISGRFDISLPLVRVLASQQGSVIGGVYDMDAKGRRGETADVRTAACAGGAFLVCGLLREARMCGRFLLRAVQAQPEEGRFHLRLDSRGNVVQRIPRAGADAYAIAQTERRSKLSHLAAPAIFLTKLHLATGDPESLEAAMDYLAFAEGCCADAEANDDPTHGWAAAALYAITRRRAYYDIAERVAQASADRQKPDGSWRLHGATRDDAATMALTTETALCLLESLREAQ